MAKQLNVNMNFTADTSNVENNLNKLKASLNQIASTPIKIGNVNEDLKQASVAARQLQVHLNNAFNTKTGNLDLGKLQSSLDKSGQSLTQLSKGLLGAGKDGQQAFLQMQTAIHNANIQIKKSTGFLAEMGTVLKNTIRWQLSSSMVHGFMSGVQQATGYVKDLNKSLTNIRIVTGQSTDDMAKFAEQANKSAKALSSTTTAYTNAALIYYQQGLDDKAVKERTDATIKMSNVTGQSAEEVSSYMTAIWNNFDDGSKSLEHYADVITALGASTASSSKEIAEGLEKFAAIGKTVGLSYDYATTALATVVAQTRQSADVVGTAFKTLFARIQDLELGKTLDDGTTLGKYSQALEAVGVNIKDSQGNLKNMNTILDEMGAKWTTLSKDQQVALAQNVAGVRQYTQLVALMDNWDKFQQNLGVAQNSEGALQEQADIYAESWEGASKRVKASMQGIYSDLINDKAMIKGTNAVADLLDGFDKIIEAAGGLKTIIFALGAVVTRIFKQDIANGLDIALQKVSHFSTALISTKEKGQSLGDNFKQIDNRAILSDAALARQSALNYAQNTGASADFIAQLKVQNDIFNIEDEIYLKSKQISDSKRIQLETDKEILQNSGNRLAALEKEKEENQKLIADEEKKAELSMKKSGYYDTTVAANRTNFDIQSKAFKNTEQAEKARDIFTSVMGDSITDATLGGSKGTKIDAAGNYEKINERRTKLVEINKEILSIEEKIAEEQKIRGNITEETIELEKELIAKLNEEGIITKKTAKTGTDRKRRIEEAKENIGTTSGILYGDREQIERIAKAKRLGAKSDADTESTIKQYETRKNKLMNELSNLDKEVKVPDLSQSFTGLINGASQAAMSISMLVSSFKTLTDEEAGAGEKLMAFGMLLSSSIGSITSVTGVLKSLGGMYKGLTTAHEAYNIIKKAEIAMNPAVSAALGKENTARLINYAAAQKAAGVEEKIIANDIKEVITKAGVTDATMAEAGANGILAASNEVTAGSFMGVAAAEMAALWPIGLLVAALGLLAGAIYLVVKASKADEEALEQANKQLSLARDHVNETAEAYNSLNTILDEIANKRKGLDELKEGTVEWQTAVAELNQQFLELADTYGLIYGTDYTMGADGTYQFLEGREVAVKEAAAARMNQANVALGQARINRNNAQNMTTAGDVGAKYTHSEETGVAGDVTRTQKRTTSTTVGFTSQTQLDVINAGLEDPSVFAAESTSEFREALIAQNEAFKNYSDEQIQGLYDYKDAFQEASVKVAQTNADSLGALEGIIASNNADNEEYINSDYKKVYSKVIKDNQEQRAKDAEKEWKDLNSNKDRAEQYLKDQYGDGTTYDETKYRAIHTKGDNFTVQKLSDNGEWVTQGDKNGVSYDEALELRKTTASTTIDKDVTDEYKRLIDEAKTALGTSINGLSKSAKDVLIAAKATGEAADFSSLTSKQIGELAKSNDSYIKEQLQKFDAKNQQTLNEKVKNLGLDNTTKYQDKNGNEYTQEDVVKEQLNALYNSQASYEDKALMMKVNITGDMIDENGNIDMGFFQRKIDEQRKLEFKAEISAAAENDQQAKDAGLEAEEVANYAEYLAELSKNEKDAKVGTEELSEELQDNAASAESMARQVMRMNKGVETLSSNWEEWGSILKKSSKGSKEYFEALSGIKDAVADLLDIESDAISSNFVEDHLEEIGKAAKGDAKAIDKLRSSLDEEIITKITAEINDKEIIKKINGLDDEIQTIASDLPDIEVGATLQDEEFLNAANELVESANMTADEANAYFAGIGYEPVYSTEDIEDANSMQSPNAMTSVTMSGISWSEENVKIGEHELPIKAPTFNIQTKSTPLEPTDAGADVRLTSFSGDKRNLPKIKGLRKKATGSANNSSSANKGGKKSSGGGGGGGGSKKSHTSSKQRYHTIDKQIGDNKRAYEALEKAKSKAYGADKLKAMDAEIKKNDELIKQTRQRAAEVEKYRKEDKKALEDAAKNFGIKVQYDKNGNIANYDAIMDQADKKAKSGDEEVEEKYTKLTEAINQYEETLEEAATTQDSLNELIEKTAQIELDKIEYKVDVKLELNERELRKLDYQIKQWERVNQNGFKDTTYVNNILGKMAENQNKYNIEENAIKEILKNRGANDKTIAKFLSGKLSNKELRALGLTDAELQSIKEHSDNMLGYAESISDAQDQIYSVFGENLEVYQSKYDEQINAIEHQKNIVSGLQEVFTLTGKGNAELLRQMRESVKEATLTGGLVAKQNMENVKTEMDRLQKLRDDAEKDGNDALVASLDSQLNTYQEYYNEQEEAYINALQETIELIKENLEASLEDFSKEYQKGIAGAYGTFGALELAMEMDEETRNMVVAPYQKAYELSKLTRDIQKSVDETDNIKAKQTLLKLEEKINAAREEGVELTQYDLDRMRAEYDLEIAKIALEEAQNAKNTVRMQRDNNGNWSYVYTADTDKIADAQQKYEDAVNAMRKLDDERLYSVQQQVVQIYKELDERIKDILTNDAYSDEEKQTMIAQARETAKEQLTILGEEMQRVLNNQKDFYENEAENYHRFTNRNIEELGRWNTAFKDTLLGQANGYESGAEMVDSLEGSVNKYVNKAVEAFEKSKEAEKDAMEQLGVDTTTANGAINELNTTLQTTVKTIEDLGTALANADLAALTKINDASGKYQVTIDGADETFGAITLNLKKLAGFDTGGYTGDWNSTNGKLALLHQKELVLNESQTRDLLETIKLLENYVLPTIRLAKFDNLNKKNATLDQHVTIQAEFPNVTNHLEIEEAFNNLINTASQYANRK